MSNPIEQLVKSAYMEGLHEHASIDLMQAEAENTWQKSEARKALRAMCACEPGLVWSNCADCGVPISWDEEADPIYRCDDCHALHMTRIRQMNKLMREARHASAVDLGMTDDEFDEYMESSGKYEGDE